MSTPGADERAAAGPDEPEEGQRPEDRSPEEGQPAGEKRASGEGQPADEDQPAQRPDESQAKPSALPPLVRGVGALPRFAAARAGRLPLRWRIASVAVLGALAVGAVVSAVLLALAAHHDDVVSRVSAAARQAAAAEMRQILSYDYRTINADLARARSDTTGEFRQQFGIIATEIIARAAPQQQTVTKATVPNASVVSATADQVVVLVFVDESTTNKTQRQPQQVASQVRVTMQQSGGRWLVAQFQAL